jgi:hypothetical protein
MASAPAQAIVIIMLFMLTTLTSLSNLTYQKHPPQNLNSKLPESERGAHKRLMGRPSGTTS